RRCSGARGRAAPRARPVPDHPGAQARRAVQPRPRTPLRVGPLLAAGQPERQAGLAAVVLQPALSQPSAVNDPDCIFCQIITGARPGHVVLESAHAIAFLDARPVFPGHSLLVPRDHHETLADLPAALVGELFGDAQRLAVAVEKGMDAQGTFVAMNNKI